MKSVLRVFKALSEPTRLRIIMLLLRRELCVCELMFILKMEQSRLSHQLRVLRDAELVEDIREGRWIIYRIPEAIKRDLQQLLERLFQERLRDSEQTKIDVESLELCLREEVRRKRRLLRKRKKRS